MSKISQLLLLLLLAGIVSADAAAYNNATYVPHSCGGVDIPYPFGIRNQDGNGSFREGFGLTCKDGKPWLTTGSENMSLLMGNFSIKRAEARVWLPVAWQCYNSSGKWNGSSQYVNIPGFRNGSAFRVSYAKNYFFVLGCNTMGYLWSYPLQVDGGSNQTEVNTQLAGCMAYCNDYQSVVNGVCSGVGCCHADIPPNLVGKSVGFPSILDRTDLIKFSPCDYAFLAEKDYYTFHTADLNMDLHRTPRVNPVTINWAIRDSSTCEEAKKKKDYACISSNSLCLNSTNGPGYICNCSDGYEGNPYITDGCTDINECDRLGDEYHCMGVCKNNQGSYKCTCPWNTHSADPKKERCISDFPAKAKIILGAIGGLLIIITMVFFLLLVKQRRKAREHFVKNGGPALAKLNNIRLFTKEDLRKIQKSNNVIGSGGFGKVYRGHIEDINHPVAVKEPINGSSADRDQFVNEINIQSRVIHKNIVKLVGCCLEVDVPILVYEFVPNGSLHDILHGSNRMTLDMGRRLRIVAESAEGLAYMHSKTNNNILHGDVKPANILLTDEFIPKISDFGISRLIATDMQHTRHVIGDLSYMDPVFLQTGLLTNKSDVYSFGVVLLEVITRKKASHSNSNNLLRNFLEAYTKDKSVIELIDMELTEVDREILDGLGEMIMHCLNLDVSQRPEMIDVAERLREMVKRFDGK